MSTDPVHITLMGVEGPSEGFPQGRSVEVYFRVTDDGYVVLCDEQGWVIEHSRKYVAKLKDGERAAAVAKRLAWGAAWGAAAGALQSAASPKRQLRAGVGAAQGRRCYLISASTPNQIIATSHRLKSSTRRRTTMRPMTMHDARDET
jgi:hypothetical protein